MTAYLVLTQGLSQSPAKKVYDSGYTGVGVESLQQWTLNLRPEIPAHGA